MLNKGNPVNENRKTGSDTVDICKQFAGCCTFKIVRNDVIIQQHEHQKNKTFKLLTVKFNSAEIAAAHSKNSVKSNIEREPAVWKTSRMHSDSIQRPAANTLLWQMQSNGRTVQVLAGFLRL